MSAPVAPLASPPKSSGPRTIAWLSALGAVAIVVALLTPEGVDNRGGLSTYGVGPGGAGIVFELSRRLGWNAVRRTTAFEVDADPSSVQVVIGPASSLGA